MAAAIGDKFHKVGVAGTLTTLAAPGKAEGAASINVDSTTNWPEDTSVVFGIRTIDADGDLVAGTYTEFEGIVSAAGVISGLTATPRTGSDQAYAAGATTQVFIPLSAAEHEDLIDGILEEHNQDGTHSDVTADTVTTTGNGVIGGTLDVASTLTVDTVNEKTSGNGVVMDGVTLKDGIVQPKESTVTTSTNATINTDSIDFFTVTALASAMTIESPTGSPVNGQRLIIRILDNGTNRALTWNAAFRAVGVDLPTATVANKTVYVGALYNSADSKWDVIVVNEEE